jgi:Fic family protein
MLFPIKVRLDPVIASEYGTIIFDNRFKGKIMSLEAECIKWIWQHKKYPKFYYDKNRLSTFISEIEYLRGVLDGYSKLFNEDDIRKIEIERLVDEAIYTSLIEGEVFKRESVRSSLQKRLDKEFDARGDEYATATTDSLVEILIDCSLNKKPLTLERLHGWHNCLFEHQYSKLHKINVATFRKNDDMKVVSGAIGYERVHYLAPPSDKIDEDITKLLAYCNTSDENIYIKSAITHLWFVIIHPYEDGNGRVSRAITDYILSQGATFTQFKLYSISTAINSDRKGYYDILDSTTSLFKNREFDITPWIEWHLLTLKNAMKSGLKSIEYLVQKTKFWDKYREYALNERQIKVINKILDMGSENFEGGISTKKYISLTKVSKATAVRDISQLVEFGCIKQIEGSSGRNIRYKLKGNYKLKGHNT